MPKDAQKVKAFAPLFAFPPRLFRCSHFSLCESRLPSFSATRGEDMECVMEKERKNSFIPCRKIGCIHECPASSTQKIGAFSPVLRIGFKFKGFSDLKDRIEDLSFPCRLGPRNRSISSTSCRRCGRPRRQDREEYSRTRSSARPRPRCRCRRPGVLPRPGQCLPARIRD